MAEKDIVFKASIDESGEGAKSLADLKKEFKDLNTELSKTKEGTAEYLATLQKLGQVKDDIGDLRDTISALNPEGKVAAFQNVASKLAGGFQAATGAAALFGVATKDIEKTLLKVQAATAFAEGIRSVAGLTDAFKVLGVVLKANPIFILLGVITGITVAIKLYNDAFGETAVITKQLTEDIKAQANAFTELEGELNQMLRLARAYGESQEQLLKREIELEKAREASANKQIRALEELIYLNGQNTEENLKQLETLTKERDESVLKQAEAVLSIERIEREAREKDLIEKRKKAEEERKLYNDTIDAQYAKQDEAAQRDLENREKEKERKTEEDNALQEYLLNAQQTEDDLAEQNKERRKKDIQEITDAEKAAAEEQAAARVAAVDQSLNAAKALSDAFFNGQLARAKGNAAEELKIRKKQFEVDKAFSIARAVIDGFRAVQAALTIPPPAGYILAAASGILAAANVVKIATTKFDGGASGADTGGLNVTPPNAAPIITNAPTIAPRQDTTKLDSSGKNISNKPEKVILVETDVTESQNRVNKLKVQSSF